MSMFCSFRIFCCRFLADAPVKLNTVEELVLFWENVNNFTNVSIQGLFAKNNDTGTTCGTIQNYVMSDSIKLVTETFL